MRTGDFLTPRQCRMARAALDVTLREVGAVVGFSRQSLCSYERGQLTALSGYNTSKLYHYFVERGITFLLPDGVYYCPEEGEA
jgi:DNA-binding XRE family transcriptional regulator